MNLSYIKVAITLQFSTAVRWSTIPTFVIRSILGANLKKICCIQRQASCDNCILAETCAYSVLFESPIPVNNAVLKGRNRAYHPYILTHKAVLDSGLGYEFILTLIGRGIQYFPFVVYALQQAGNEGVFSSKIGFTVSRIVDNKNKKPLLGKVLGKPVVQQFDFLNNEHAIVNAAEIIFITPARIKYLGRYTTMFDSYSLFGNLFQRIVSLIQLYENHWTESIDNYIKNYRIPTNISIIERKLIWKDFKRYSRRQHTEMELGGVIGTLILQGAIGWQEQKLLEGGTLFHVGKNTVFGLGEMSYQILNQ